MWPLYTANPVCKGHSREPENVAFIYRLKLYALYINGKNETASLSMSIIETDNF
jgi:hypothetical protein